MRVKLLLFALFGAGLVLFLPRASWLVRGVNVFLLAGVFAIVIHSFYDFNLFVPANAVLFTVIAVIASGREPGD